LRLQARRFPLLFRRIELQEDWRLRAGAFQVTTFVATVARHLGRRFTAFVILMLVKRSRSVLCTR
jgi:hypothetical protein